MKRFYLSLAALLFAASSFAQTVSSVTLPPGTVSRATKFKMAETPAGRLVKGADGDLSTDIIRTQPAGTLHKNLYRKSTSYSLQYGFILKNDAEGFVNNLVEGPDGEVYMDEPYLSLVTRSWLKGYKAKGDTICFDFPQPVYRQEGNTPGDSLTFYAYKMVMSIENDEASGQQVVNCYPDDKTQTVKFVWRNDTLKCVDDAFIGLASPAGRWMGFGEENIQLSTIRDMQVEAPQNAAGAREYSLQSTDPLQGNENVNFVNVLTAGDSVYVKGIYSGLPEAWIKGSLKDGKAVFRRQYLGTTTMLEKQCHVFFLPVTMSMVYNEEYQDYDYGYVPADSAVFDYDEAGGTFTSDSTLVVNMGLGNPTYNYFNIYATPVLAPFTEVADTPQDPVFTNVLGYDDQNGFGVVLFDLPVRGVNGGLLDPSKMYYEVEIDGEVKTFSPDEYKYIGEEMTQVPYSFTDQHNFFVNGTTHTLYYFKKFGTIGVQLFSTAGGQTRASKKITYEMPTQGIRSAVASSQPVAVTWHDLSGRTVSAPRKGLYIKTVTFADGTQKTFKTVRK